MAAELLLEVSGLRVRFDSPRGVARAVDGVDLGLRAGETLCVVGESGCGKSVTALSLMGLLPSPPAHTEGSIRFQGRELVGLSDAELSDLRGNRLAMIFQEPMTSLNPAFTVGDQLAEVLMRHRGLDRKTARTAVLEMLRKVRIPAPEQRIDEHPHRMSGGMRQRVMIAMALLCQPALLIADEPTTALDVTIQAQVLSLMRTLRQETGTAILLITHDLGVVAEMADRVVVMYAGQVVEQATVQDLFDMPQHPYTVGLLGAIPSIDRPCRRAAGLPAVAPLPTNAATAMRHRWRRSSPGTCRVAGRHRCRPWRRNCRRWRRRYEHAAKP